MCCTRWIAAHISTDLAACCTLRPRPIPTRTIHPPHTSHLNLVETSLSRCCFPLASRLARTARRHLEARQRRGSPGTTPQYPSPDRHRPHALPLLYHLATPSPRIAARDPETSSVPSHTTSHARSHVSQACTYRPTRPSGTTRTPAHLHHTRPDHNPIRITRLNGSVACADPMLHYIPLRPRSSEIYYCAAAAAHTAA